MDDHRPVPTADPHNPSPPSSLDSDAPARTADVAIEPSPPFRSSRVVLDDGRAVGLTEPFPNPGGSRGPTRLADPARPGWIPTVPSGLRPAWGGVGSWLGAVTVVGVAAFVLSLTLADVVGDSRSSDRAGTDEEALGIDVGGGIGAPSDEQRASRARTTGELTENDPARGPAPRASGRSSGPSSGIDLDLGYRSGGDPAGGAGPAATLGAAGPPQSAGDPAGSTDAAPAGSAGADETSSPATATAAATSIPGSGSSTATSAPVTGAAAVDGGWPGSVPPGSTSVPEPGTLPPPVTLPSPVTLPPSITLPAPGPSTGDGPSTTPTRPSVPAAPPTTRRPVPADTRPPQATGRGRGPERGQDAPGGAAPANRSNGRAVGRPQ